VRAARPGALRDFRDDDGVVSPLQVYLAIGLR
jgi:hypothetical protein